MEDKSMEKTEEENGANRKAEENEGRYMEHQGTRKSNKRNRPRSQIKQFRKGLGSKRVGCSVSNGHAVDRERSQGVQHG